MPSEKNTKPDKRRRPARSRAAVAALVAKNIGLVGFYARSYMRTGFLSFDDFVGEGYVALVHAAKQWPGHQTNFNNYAAVSIRRAMEHAVQTFKRHGDVVHRSHDASDYPTCHVALEVGDEEYGANAARKLESAEFGPPDTETATRGDEINAAVSRLTYHEYQAFRLTTATLGIDSRRSIRQAAGELDMTVEETQAAVDRAREKLRAALESQ
jgi:RNA polymerase sigma factor (sigma-70 family)